MEYLSAALLGIVEGITEFLPISSTAHLVLASRFLGIGQSDFQKTFEIVIQLGAILAVVVLYWRALLNVELLKRLAVAFVPTGIIGFTLYGVVRNYLLGNPFLSLSVMILGGILLIVFELWHREDESALADMATMPYKTAALIGLFQAVAIVPGVSRSAATILGGLLLGLRRTTIVEFSFLLAVPTMVAASGLDLVKHASAFSAAQAGVLAVGFVTAFVVAMITIKWLLGFIRAHSFIPFGIYRVIFGGILLGFLVGIL